MAGKLLTGKNMADIGQNRHFFPAIIIPSKVYTKVIIKPLIWEGDAGRSGFDGASNLGIIGSQSLLHLGHCLYG